MSTTQLGIQGYSGGAIADQTLLLRDIKDGLMVYNANEDPLINLLSEETIRQTLRVSQAPKTFGRHADGAKPNSQRAVYRDLNVPFDSYDLSSEFTILWLQDALSSDVITEVNTAMLGDTELVNSLFYQAIFTKQTVGAIGTAYQAGFYNGETDVPSYKNNSFASAHYHYLGLNTTTLTIAHWRSMKIDIQQHGYGMVPGSLIALIHTDQVAAVMALVNTNSADTVLQAITANREKAIDQGLIRTGIMIEGVMVYVDDNVPSGYLAMVATDVKPVARRAHLDPAFRGLQMYQSGPSAIDFPLAGMAFIRRIGFAVQHLGAGTCRQLVGSTTYTNPTFRLG